MKRILYLDKKSDEINNILTKKKNTLMRAANIKKYPFEMIDRNDRLYFINNNTEGLVLASATAQKVRYLHLSKEDSNKLIDDMEPFLLLTKKKLDYMRNRKYVTIITLSDIKKEYATLDESKYGIVEDWVIINNIKE